MHILLPVNENLPWCLLTSKVLDEIYKKTKGYADNGQPKRAATLAGNYFERNVIGLLNSLLSLHELKLSVIPGSIQGQGRTILKGADVEKRQDGSGRGITISDGIDQLALLGGPFYTHDSRKQWKGGIIDVKRTEAITLQYYRAQLDAYARLSEKAELNGYISYITTLDTKIHENVFSTIFNSYNRMDESGKKSPIIFQQFFILYAHLNNTYFFRFNNEFYSNQSGVQDLGLIPDNNILLQFCTVFDDIIGSVNIGIPAILDSQCEKLIDRDFNQTSSSSEYTTIEELITVENTKPKDVSHSSNEVKELVDKLQTIDSEHWPQELYNLTIIEYNALFYKILTAIHMAIINIAKELIDDLYLKLIKSKILNIFGFLIDIFLSIIPTGLLSKLLIIFALKVLKRAQLIKKIENAKRVIELVETIAIAQTVQTISTTVANRNASLQEINQNNGKYNHILEDKESIRSHSIEIDSVRNALVYRLEKMFESQKILLSEDTDTLEDYFKKGTLTNEGEELLTHMIFRIGELQKLNKLLTNKNSTEYKSLTQSYNTIAHCLWLGFDENGNTSFETVSNRLGRLDKQVLSKLIKTLVVDVPPHFLNNKKDLIDISFKKVYFAHTPGDGSRWDIYGDHKILDNGITKEIFRNQLMVFSYMHEQIIALQDVAIREYITKDFSGSTALVPRNGKHDFKVDKQKLPKGFIDFFESDFEENYLALKIYIFCLNLEKGF